MGISKQGDAMARHYLYEAANVLLTTVKKRFALTNWGLRLVKTIGPKRARVASRESWLCCLDECGKMARTLKRPLQRKPGTSRSMNRRI